jgi:DNA polymerase III delta subunit
MIYLFLGQYKKASKKASILVDALLKKQPDATVLKFNDVNFEKENIADLIATQGLFFNKNIIVLSKINEKEENKEKILENIGEIKSSQNVFVFIEESLDKKSLEKFKKNSEKIEELKSEEKKEKEKFNIFSLTDALGKKDKKNLWLLYCDAIKKSAPEEIYGILWWQMKTLLIVKKSNSAADSGLKPFVFNKSKTFLKNFRENELEKKAFELVKIYHNSRRKSLGLETGLEKWILAFD